jgi:uncharacterized protein
MQKCSYYGRMKCTRWLPRLLLLLIVALPACAEKVSTIPAPTGYVDDYAGVISPSAKTQMEATCNEVHDKTRAQIFLVTVKTTEGEEVQTFANELFAKWKIGEKKTDRGVLILLAINDRKRWIEIGYGLEGILNDAKVGDIGRQMVPALQATHYDEATKIGLREVSRVIAADAGVAIDGLEAPAEQETQTAPPEATPPPARSPFLAALLIAFTLGPVLLFIALFIWRVKHGMRMASGISGSGSDGGSDRDIFSDSSSGSGDSFSGGDGGSSGGGGAGGDW